MKAQIEKSLEQIVTDLDQIRQLEAQNNESIRERRRWALRRRSIAAFFCQCANDSHGRHDRRVYLTEAKHHREMADIEEKSIERLIQFNTRLAPLRARDFELLDDLLVLRDKASAITRMESNN